MPSNSRTPIDLTIRAYNVGFGDCNLLTFRYQNFSRNILIDFGSTRRPANSKRNNTKLVAKQIGKDCDGKLDAIVATHRHKDHISGFLSNASGTGAGDIIRKLEPDFIVQPWTEHPGAPVDANVAPSLKSFHAHQKRFADMDVFARSIGPQLRRLGGVSLEFKRRLKFMGENNISNLAAIKNLQRMADEAKDRGENSRHGGYFVYSGSNSGLGHLLPNVDVHVLGPPTLKQTETIKNQVHDHSDEFWHLQAENHSAFAEDESLFPGRETTFTPSYARWFKRRLQQLRADDLFRIVRILDNALNNTSVILLFTVGKRGFLFPGDAQWENWAYALNQPKYVKLLKNVELYKIGHHGSLNATPKSLWSLFRNKGPAGTKNRMQSILSTKEGVHGKPENDSEVPRGKLIRELREQSKLIDTRNSGTASHCVKTVIKF